MSSSSIVTSAIIPTSQIFQKGNTAVITGASSGIGRCASLECASKGMNVWMIDIDERDLYKAQNDIREKYGNVAPGQKIEAIVADVADEQSIQNARDQIMKDCTTKSIHFLMNNAAKQIGGSALDTTMDTFNTMMKINLYGAIHTCQQFIPIMKQNGHPGIIVNTGSKQGITMPPGNLTYNVSKAALKAWTEGLEHDLMMERLNKKGKLKSALLVPGWTNTSIIIKEKRDRAQMMVLEDDQTKFDYDAVKKETTHEDNPANGAWMPKQVFDYMIDKLDKGSFYIICPDNEVDSFTDKVRMTWTMQDITEDRPPLSRWNPAFKDEFGKFLQSQKQK